jgi:hypothetical protein
VDRHICCTDAEHAGSAPTTWRVANLLTCLPVSAEADFRISESPATYRPDDNRFTRDSSARGVAQVEVVRTQRSRFAPARSRTRVDSAAPGFATRSLRPPARLSCCWSRGGSPDFELSKYVGAGRQHSTIGRFRSMSPWMNVSFNSTSRPRILTSSASAAGIATRDGQPPGCTTQLTHIAI